jgi:4a-hydroxytetrahydrobiopterin dehydratase
MNDLARKKCVPCEGGVAPLTDEQVRPMLKGLQGWSRDGKAISKTYKFKNYYETMAFVNAAAWISHREDHHPDLAGELGRVPRLVRDARDRGPLGERFHLPRKLDALFDL